MKIRWLAATVERAFARFELVFVLLGATLLFAIAVPLLAGNNPRSELAVCMNNLRQIGMGLRTWANEHDDRYHWRVSTAEGGSQQPSKTGNNWYEFNVASNYLQSPKLLVCPSDTIKTPAQRWGGGVGGIAHVSAREYAVSFFVGLHAVRDNPQSLVSGDHHFAYSPITGTACETGINNAGGLTPGNPNVGWTNDIHGLRGNLLFNSGEVSTVPKEEFNQVLDDRTDEDTIHILPSR